MRNDTDNSFLRACVMLDMAALMASKSAEGRCLAGGVRAELRALAAQMGAVLARIDAECRRSACRLAVALAEGPDARQREALAALETLDGAAFETVYLAKFVLEAQLELMRLCDIELRHGADEGLRTAAGRWLLDLREALAPARRLYFAPAG